MTDQNFASAIELLIGGTVDTFVVCAGAGLPVARKTVAEVKTLLNLAGNNTGDQSLFSTIAVSGQSNVVADSATDTLTLVEGSGITITTDAATDSITITASTGGGNVSKVGTPANNQVGVWTGDGTIEGDSALTYDSTTDTLTSVNFAGNLTGNVTGNASGSSGSCTGNAATSTLAAAATVLATPRAINGVNFDGSAAVTVTAAGSTLSDTVTVAKGGTGLTAVGSALQVLRTNAGANALEWATPSAGGSGLTVDAQTITTADVTGVVNKLYVCTIAGLTGHRNLTLPSGTAGDRIGVYILDGDATYSLILKGDTGVTINGGATATEWSRLFILSEYVEFYCTAANTWIVNIDRRIRCTCRVRLAAAIAASTAATVTLINYDTEDWDVGDIFDHVTNKYLTCRRAGMYEFKSVVFPNAVISDQKYYSAALYDNSIGSFTKSYAYDFRRQSIPGSSSVVPITLSAEDSLAVGALVVPIFAAEETNVGVDNDQSASTIKMKTFFFCTEKLP